MKRIFLLLVVSAASAWMAAAGASTNVADVASVLEDTHVDIRSMVDPATTVSNLQSVSVVLPDKPSVADKQLAELMKANLSAQGFKVTSPDRSRFTLTATVHDYSSLVELGEHSPVLGDTPEAATLEFATITVEVYTTGNPNDPVWYSAAKAYSDFWTKNRQVIIAGILATYGRDFFYRNIRPSNIPDAVKDNKNQPPTVQDIKACLAYPDGKDCDDTLGK